MHAHHKLALSPCPLPSQAHVFRLRTKKLSQVLTDSMRVTLSCQNNLCVSQGKNDEVTYVFEPACHLGAKLAGVHWWFKSRAHAAELTAGYYNTRERDGYAPLMNVLKKYHTHLSFTCVEMRDCEHPPEGRCSPQGVVAVAYPLCCGQPELFLISLSAVAQ